MVVPCALGKQGRPAQAVPLAGGAAASLARAGLLLWLTKVRLKVVQLLSAGMKPDFSLQRK